MKLLKLASFSAAIAFAAVIPSVGAQAALNIAFPAGQTSGTFGDSNIGSGAYSQTGSFLLNNAGSGFFTASSTSTFFDITSIFIDFGKASQVAFTPIINGPVSDFFTLSTPLAGGFHTLTVNGSVPAAANGTGSYGGSINFVPSAVPEPAAWAFMVFGIGAAGTMARRRKVAVTSVKFA